VGERVRLRLLGAWHGLRGVTGRTLDPTLWARPSVPSAGSTAGGAKG
jgi:hypothetical protein